MIDIEYVQMARYFYPLIKDGFNKSHYSKMKILEKLELTKDYVFVSSTLCDKELFMAVLFFLKNAPNYTVIDAYKLKDIDTGALENDGYSSLYNLTKPEVLFIRYGISDGKLSDKLRDYIRNCIDLVVDSRRYHGKRTFIFAYGKEEDFLKLGSGLMKNIELITVADGGAQ